MGRKKKEETRQEVAPQWKSTKISERVMETRKTYSCGCPLVKIDDVRTKKKCVKHGVE